jgi:hypothetical protein
VVAVGDGEAVSSVGVAVARAVGLAVGPAVVSGGGLTVSVGEAIGLEVGLGVVDGPKQPLRSSPATRTPATIERPLHMGRA